MPFANSGQVILKRAGRRSDKRYVISVVDTPTNELGPELWPQPTFASGTGLTLVNTAISANGLDFGGVTDARATATAVATLVAGTYRIVFTPGAQDTSSTIRVRVGGSAYNSGGALHDFFDENPFVPQTFDLVVASVAGQVLAIVELNGDVPTVRALSIKQVL